MCFLWLILASWLRKRARLTNRLRQFDCQVFLSAFLFLTRFWWRLNSRRQGAKMANCEMTREKNGIEFRNKEQKIRQFAWKVLRKTPIPPALCHKDRILTWHFIVVANTMNDRHKMSPCELGIENSFRIENQITVGTSQKIRIKRGYGLSGDN